MVALLLAEGLPTDAPGGPSSQPATTPRQAMATSATAGRSSMRSTVRGAFIS